MEMETVKGWLKAEENRTIKCRISE